MQRQIFDAHLHIIAPAFPLRANKGYLPEAFTVDDYLERARPLGITAGAVVSGSFQGFDQEYLLSALERLGRQFIGVTQLPAATSDDRILQMNERGVRGVRFNLKRGGSESLEHLGSFAKRIFDLAGWHVELYVDGKGLKELEETLRLLPAVSIDHLGLTREGLPVLLRLVEQGVKVKASGFGRVDFSVARAIKAIHEANPSALMFGTDLPSTRARRAFNASDITLIAETIGPAGAELVFWDNAFSFYRMHSSAEQGQSVQD